MKLYLDKVGEEGGEEEEEGQCLVKSGKKKKMVLLIDRKHVNCEEEHIDGSIPEEEGLTVRSKGSSHCIILLSGKCRMK